ncbi:MAG: sulfofructose kinase [Thermoanaerobaculia bacterium]|nr:sulfofructose kinase [Thermoanaerobaculia bacterium]
MTHPAAPYTHDVLGLGESSVDHVNLLPTAPLARGTASKLRISSAFDAAGGQVASMLAACSALGLRTGYLGPLGNDANGRLIRDELVRRGVDVSSVIVREAPARFAIILVDESTGERTVLWHRDPGLDITEAEIDPAVLTARVLHVDDVDEEAAIRTARLAAARGVLVTSDLDRVTERTTELVASVSIPIFAEHVPPTLTGERDPERALRKLRNNHRGVLCVTLGTAGSMALDGDRLIHVPAFSVHAVDTTGAGDVFRAGFVYGLLAGRPMLDVLKFANAAAAVSCTRLGAMGSAPTLAEVEQMLAGEFVATE